MIGAIDCSTIHYASHAYLALYRSFCVFAPIKSYDQERAVTISLSISCVITVSWLMVRRLRPRFGPTLSLSYTFPEEDTQSEQTVDEALTLLVVA
jgi:hypothetical protein